MKKKPDISRNILKLLAQKNATALPELTEKIVSGSVLARHQYALNRSLRSLQKAGLIESIHSGQNDFVKLTEHGKRKISSLHVESKSALLNPLWDGKWRIILLDLPESRKSERESLRYLLKKAGFVMLKNSAWISPYPFEHLFANIKKDLGFSTEIMIIVTDSIDSETKKELLRVYR